MNGPATPCPPGWTRGEEKNPRLAAQKERVLFCESRRHAGLPSGGGSSGTFSARAGRSLPAGASVVACVHARAVHMSAGFVRV